MLTSQRTVREISRSSILAKQGCLIAFPNVPPERSGERLALRHAWRPWTRFRLGRVFSSLGICLRRKMRAAARVAGPAIILCALPGFASAQDATWVLAQAPRTLTARPTGHRQRCRSERRLSATQARKRLRSLRTPRSAPCSSMRRIIRSNSRVLSIRLRSPALASRPPIRPMRRRSMFPFRSSYSKTPARLGPQLSTPSIRAL